jgi:hypothetical protein
MRYANKRMMFRSGGRFAKTPSLAEMGLPVNTGGELACRGCSKKSIPILITGTCSFCGLERAFIEPEPRV